MVLSRHDAYKTSIDLGLAVSFSHWSEPNTELMRSGGNRKPDLLVTTWSDGSLSAKSVSDDGDAFLDLVHQAQWRGPR